MANIENARIISLTNNPFAKKLINKLNFKEIKVSSIKFANQELLVSAKESVRGKHIYVIQTFEDNLNERIMELFIFMDSLKRSSAKSINVVIPFYPYSRQDRKAKSREPITSKMLADILQTCGATRVITFDIHAPQIQGFFNIPADNYTALPLFYSWIKDNFSKDEIDDLVIVSPDHGGVNRARQLCDWLSDKTGIAIVDKRRTGVNKAESYNVIGDVSGKNCIVVDDMVDTGGSLIAAVEKIKETGAKKVYACITHAVCSEGILDKVKSKAIEKLIVTNSLYREEIANSDKFEIVCISDLFSKAILHTYNEMPVTGLFSIPKEDE